MASNYSNDTDGVYFASLVDYLSAYPRASLGSVMALLKTGDQKKQVQQESTLSSNSRLGPAACGKGGHRKQAWPLEKDELALIEAWRSVFADGVPHPALADVTRRTELFSQAALTLSAEGGGSQPQGAAAIGRVMKPLLERLHQEGLGSSRTPATVLAASSPFQPERAAGPEGLHPLFSAYGRLLPQALAVAAQEATGVGAALVEGLSSDRGTAAEREERRAALYLWLWRQSALNPGYLERRNEVVRDLLAPYVATVVQPLEKQLRFHFQPGSDTAKKHEPQHFFSFLAELLTTRLREAHMAAVGAAATIAGQAGPAALSLLTFGQVALCATATVTFQETYQWTTTSPSLTATVFTVHVLNSLFDFVAAHEAHVAREALVLVVRHIAFRSAVDVFLDAAAATAAEAFASAPRVLWRRVLLCEAARGPHKDGLMTVPRAGVLFTRTVRLVRCLESLVRRLSGTLLLADPQTWRAAVWARPVAASLGTFLDAVQDALLASEGDIEGEQGWVLLCLRFEMMESLHLVAAAAEDWLGLLLGDGPATPAARVSAEALDELILLRDRTVRSAAATSRRLLSSLLLDGGV